MNAAEKYGQFFRYFEEHFQRLKDLNMKALEDKLNYKRGQIL